MDGSFSVLMLRACILNINSRLNQQSFSSKSAASSMELAVVEAQNPFSAHCIVLHRIASYQYNISCKNQQAQQTASELSQAN